MNNDLSKFAERSIGRISNADALDHLSQLIDRSDDERFQRGLERALRQLDELENRDLDPEQGTLIEYFRANAWSALERIAGHQRSWDWDREELRHQILALSRAASHPGFPNLSTIRRCQILTNRANLLSTVGRFVDAIEGWDSALAINPLFAMANGNRAFGLEHYARALYDPGHQELFLRHAHDAALRARAKDAVYDAKYPPEVPAGFDEIARRTAKFIGSDAVRDQADLNAFPLGRSKRERAYRSWCLQERLFLNPLNDLGPYSIAASDVLTLPTLIEKASEAREGRPPRIIGFYNQMKQEFVSARFMLYDGLTDNKLHFSDRDVLIYNTFDYPQHSFAIERVRSAFRIAYSLLDKVAYFVNYYWKLHKQIDRVSFSSVWHNEGKKSILKCFETNENLPLRALFWLSKDFFDKELRASTGADSRELHDLRNHLEHRYLQVHHIWERTVDPDDAGLSGNFKSISSDEMRRKALRVTKLARSALIYLALAVAREESIRNSKPPTGLVATFQLQAWEDRWK